MKFLLKNIQRYYRCLLSQPDFILARITHNPELLFVSYAADHFCSQLYEFLRRYLLSVLLACKWSHKRQSDNKVQEQILLWSIFNFLLDLLILCYRLVAKLINSIPFIITGFSCHCLGRLILCLLVSTNWALVLPMCMHFDHIAQEWLFVRVCLQLSNCLLIQSTEIFPIL